MEERSARIEQLYQRGSDQLITDSSLRDALDDDQARQLLDWGLAQVRASAEAARELAPARAEAAVDSTVQSVRRAMRQVNEMVERGAQDSNDMYVSVLQFVEALHELDQHAIHLKDLITLEKLALRQEDLSPQLIFSKLIALVNGEEEE